MKKTLFFLVLSFAIATVFGQIDLSIQNVLSPPTTGMNMGQTTVTIVLENRSATIQRNIPVKLYLFLFYHFSGSRMGCYNNR